MRSVIVPRQGKIVERCVMNDLLQVLELWFRGNASQNAFPGWGLQVGRVVLEESVLESCVIPECLSMISSDDCIAAVSDAKSNEFDDSARDFTMVFMASENIMLESANAVANFNGDDHRFRRRSPNKGIITYSMPRGIAAIDVTLYQCEHNNSVFGITPYVEPQCKPEHLQPELKDDSYQSNCWRRYKVKINFTEILDCLPTYVDLVIEGREADTLQISKIKLTGYGDLAHDPDFVERPIGDGGIPKNNDEAAEIKSEQNDQGSVKLVHWLPATIIGGFLIIVVIIGVLLYRNGEVQDFIADYIEDNFPFIYKHFYPSDSAAQNTPRVSCLLSCWFRWNACAVSRRHRLLLIKECTRTALIGLYRQRASISVALLMAHLNKPENRLLSVMLRPRVTDLASSSLIYRNICTGLSGRQKSEGKTASSKSKNVWVCLPIPFPNCPDANVLLMDSGKGGFGKVWKARWQGTPVALKVVPLHANLRQEEKQARMAIMEAALSGSHSPLPCIYPNVSCRLLSTP